MSKMKIENLTFTYPDCPSPVLKNLSFEIEAGAFLTVIGASGTGKSTLLSLLKPEISPKGTTCGHIYIDEMPLSSLSQKESVTRIGYVFQDPDKQIVTDKVWHELAFGPESLGMSPSLIRVRTAEVASYLGITDLFEKETHTLSGGQKQLVNLASVLCMNPELILLDEPTAQLDPIASEEFMEILARLHRDTGITIILVEHRLEAAAAYTDKLLILEKNGHYTFGDIKDCIASLPQDDPVLSAFPASVRLYKSVEHLALTSEIPMTIAEGRRFITGITGAAPVSSFSHRIEPFERRTVDNSKQASEKQKAIETSDVSFGYERHGKNVLQDLDLTVYSGEILTLLGGNGQGKSTLLQLIAGVKKPDSGTVRVFDKDIRKYRDTGLYDSLTLLPQQVETMFLRDSVREELKDIKEPVFPMEGLMDTHPYDLSGGEKALLGLNLVLARDIKILLLDEPTKGLDTESKRLVADALKKVRDRGITIVLVTHDLELAALLSSRIALLFNGSIAEIDEPHAFFRSNFFYTTHFARMTRGIFNDVITESECIGAVMKALEG